MKIGGVIFCWICVAVAAVFLRFDGLGERPMHADEATGARIAARRIEAGGVQFDPRHYHGPLLADLVIPVCRLKGEDGWRTMRKSTLRTLPAIAGVLLVFVPLLWRRRCGDVPVLAAGALLASSPLLVYYSRMFIHESLLVLCGLAAAVLLTRKPRLGIPGVLIGLMFAAKETFVISIIAWAGAGCLIAWERRKSLDRAVLAAAWRDYRLPVAVTAVAAAVTAFGFYTDGFRHAQGAIDAVRTFFVYETVAGHDKPLGYYFQLLVMPVKSGGVWWFGAPVLLLALVAFGSTFRRGAEVAQCRWLVRFLAYSAAGHFVLYSLIAYKNPWLACLPWAHVCLLAGFAFAGFPSRHPAVKGVLAVLGAVCVFTQFSQSRHATGRLASDERNPFAYVPTRRDVEAMEAWLEKLRATLPAGALDEVAVIGSEYWPLPWYLRSFENTGYWQEPPADLARMPLVIAMPESGEAVMRVLADTHVSVPRGLRAGVPVQLFVRNDVWKQWMETESR
jgi:uncharacterized protein (TIGR03663 family)